MTEKPPPVQRRVLARISHVNAAVHEPGPYQHRN
jgi:hypothetical protein